MRVLLQRVTHASVSVDGSVIGAVERGFVALVGVTHSDTAAVADQLAAKVAHLRVFDDDAGKMNRSALDIGAGVLVISQFTLYADARQGRRPGFTDAARPDHAAPLVEQFAARLRALGIVRVETGRFGALMQVSLVNDGPVTIWLDSADLPGT